MCFSIGLTCIQLQDGLARIGPWGGDGGTCRDINATPRRLESVTISSCLVIDSITFSFSDDNGQKHYAGPWGGSGGFDHKVRLNSNVIEFFSHLSPPTKKNPTSSYAFFLPCRFCLNLQSLW